MLNWMTKTESAEVEFTKTKFLYLSWGDLGSEIQLPILDGVLLVRAKRAKSLGVILDASLSVLPDQSSTI